MDRVVCDNLPRCINAGRREPYLSAVQSKWRTVTMGFPSPAADYVEARISLDQQLISQPAATYFMRASRSHFREGIIQGALLVVDASLSPCDGSLLICAIDGNSGSSDIGLILSPTWLIWRTGEGRRCQQMMTVTVLRPLYSE